MRQGNRTIIQERSGTGQIHRNRPRTSMQPTVKLRDFSAPGWLLLLGIASCGPAEVVSKKTPIAEPPKPVVTAQPVETASTKPAVDEDAEYQMRQMHLVEWIEKVKRDCERLKDVDAYLPVREGFLPEEIELVKTRCADAVEVGLRADAWRKALWACADRFMKANGAGKHECRLKPADVPNVPPALFDRHLAACTQACPDLAAEQIERKKELARPVRCCDGTDSPSCTYGTLRPDCCAGHRGICIGD
jgi:hypothetical protein